MITDQPFASMIQTLKADEKLVFIFHDHGVGVVEATLERLGQSTIGTLKADEPLLLFSSLSSTTARDAAVDLILNAPAGCGIGLQSGDGELVDALLSGKGFECRPQGELTVPVSGEEGVSLEMFIVQRSEGLPRSAIKPLGKKIPEPEGNLDRRADWFKKHHGGK